MYYNQSQQTCCFSTNQEQNLGLGNARFLALGTGYMFSRAWHWLYVFPRLALVARSFCFEFGLVHWIIYRGIALVSLYYAL